MSYTQNGDRIVTTDTVTPGHPMYTLPVHMTTPLNLRDFSVSPTDRFLTRARPPALAISEAREVAI